MMWLGMRDGLVLKFFVPSKTILVEPWNQSICRKQQDSDPSWQYTALLGDDLNKSLPKYLLTQTIPKIHLFPSLDTGATDFLASAFVVLGP